jgi:hypothetical protein
MKGPPDFTQVKTAQEEEREGGFFVTQASTD